MQFRLDNKFMLSTWYLISKLICTLCLPSVCAMIATRTDPELKDMFDRIHQVSSLRER